MKPVPNAQRPTPTNTHEYPRIPTNTRERPTPRFSNAFTLIELLVVIAIIAVLAAILFPVFAQARDKARQTACVSNLKQIGSAFALYTQDYDELFPDRRDLKALLPGGFRPWTSWPPYDPRAGWAAVTLEPYTKNDQIWVCPTIIGGPLGHAVEVVQPLTALPKGPVTTYWMWRFDHEGDPIILKNFWGKTDLQCVSDLQLANDPTIDYPNGPSDVMLAEDPYFPSTTTTVDPALLGLTAHEGGRTRLFLDFHAKFYRDARTSN